MSGATARRVLLLGLAGSGKSTLLIQLHGRLKAGTGLLRARGAPSTLAPIEAGLNRLEQGLAVEHTPKGTDAAQRLPAQTSRGQALDIALPEYAGEDLQTVMRERKLPDRWRELARTTDRWLLLIRLSQHPQLPDVISKPIGLLSKAPLGEKQQGPDVLPVDMWSVELLQVLMYARVGAADGQLTTPTLALVLSCWDELDVSDSTAPAQLAAERLALLDAYCRSNWTPAAYSVYGLSAQGRALDSRQASEEYVDNGPQRMGWLVLPDGKQDSDLTLLAAGG